jgi:hypothetical protein
MAVSFGFSVSDFIAGIILLKNSIEAIRNKRVPVPTIKV